MLEQIAKSAGLGYKIDGKNISVKKLEKKTIKGKITDAVTGEDLIGVSIQIKGTAEGTISDVNGEYSFLAYPNSTIQFSYIGYAMAEEEVNDRSSIDIALVEGFADFG